MAETAQTADLDRDAIVRRYRRVRARTEALAARLSPEDMLVQSMPDASPAKWHLAHTTWFFEEFVLAPFDTAHRWRDPRWRFLFNSYYEAAGPRHPRAARGLLSRPSFEEVRAWRAAVDEQMVAFLAAADLGALAATRLGTHHEEQHQELLLTDVKHALANNPLLPAYAEPSGPPLAIEAARTAMPPLEWRVREERVALIGHDECGFAFDNEGPRHRVLVGRFAIASRLVTNSEYERFVEDGGYERPELWLSDGWATGRAHGWTAPLYWERDGASDPTRRNPWTVFTLHGVQPLDGPSPVTHVSFYEADAYARWAGRRLATESEWETVAAEHRVEGNFLETGRFAAGSAEYDGDAVTQLFGDAWEWTGSAYLPYPKYRPVAGALGEYNGKFMSGQMVLRGGSCLSPQDHLRATYRNFFPPHTRWQMTGIRLAEDV